MMMRPGLWNIAWWRWLLLLVFGAWCVWLILPSAWGRGRPTWHSGTAALIEDTPSRVAVVVYEGGAFNLYWWIPVLSLSDPFAYL